MIKVKREQLGYRLDMREREKREGEGVSLLVEGGGSKRGKCPEIIR